MKIGIVTHYMHFGYGGVLQNFALQKLIRRMGHDPVTLRVSVDYPKSTSQRIIKTVKFNLKNIIGRDSGITPKQDAFISKEIEKFVAKYINCTSENCISEDFRRATERENCQIIVVGSDQIWRRNFPYYVNSFLDFTNGMDIKRIAYAASFAVDNWEFTSEQTALIKPLAKKFDAISVREASGIDLCKKYLHRDDVVLVLDPTLMLDKEDYIKIVEEANELHCDGEMFTYVLDKSSYIESIINGIAEKAGIKRYECMPKVENRSYLTVKKHQEDCVYPAITKWLRSFMDARLVVTDSFHGTAFSIIFNKPFFVLINKERGAARFTSLLHLFGLEDRIISSLDEVDVYKSIDWDAVNEKKKEWQMKSIDFLKQIL
jgi:hypothetical protein